MPFLGIGRNRRKAFEDLKNEVAFWKQELDNSLHEKHEWLEKYARTVRDAEISRAEVFLLQQETNSLRKQLKECMDRLESPRSSPAGSHGGGACDGAQAAAPTDFVPAAHRFHPVRSHQGAVTALPEYVQAEVIQLRNRLQEEKDRNRNLQREAERHQHQSDFHKASSQAYQKEADLFRVKLLAVHGIHNDTADETVRLLQDMGLLQQANAQLKREIQMKESIITLLEQQLAEHQTAMSSIMMTTSLRSTCEAIDDIIIPAGRLDEESGCGRSSSRSPSQPQRASRLTEDTSPDTLRGPPHHRTLIEVLRAGLGAVITPHAGVELVPSSTHAVEILEAGHGDCLILEAGLGERSTSHDEGHEVAGPGDCLTSHDDGHDDDVMRLQNEELLTPCNADDHYLDDEHAAASAAFIHHTYQQETVKTSFYSACAETSSSAGAGTAGGTLLHAAGAGTAGGTLLHAAGAGTAGGSLHAAGAGTAGGSLHAAGAGTAGGSLHAAGAGTAGGSCLHAAGAGTAGGSLHAAGVVQKAMTSAKKPLSPSPIISSMNPPCSSTTAASTPSHHNQAMGSASVAAAWLLDQMTASSSHCHDCRHHDDGCFYDPTQLHVVDEDMVGQHARSQQQQQATIRLMNPVPEACTNDGHEDAPAAAKAVMPDAHNSAPSYFSRLKPAADHAAATSVVKAPHFQAAASTLPSVSIYASALSEASPFSASSSASNKSKIFASASNGLQGCSSSANKQASPTQMQQPWQQYLSTKNQSVVVSGYGGSSMGEQRQADASQSKFMMRTMKETVEVAVASLKPRAEVSPRAAAAASAAAASAVAAEVVPSWQEEEISKCQGASQFAIATAALQRLQQQFEQQAAAASSTARSTSSSTAASIRYNYNAQQYPQNPHHHRSYRSEPATRRATKSATDTTED
ncbi:hypothetical protein CEUSTIGMA_g9307.t1 [Chlamydomonas eustigma]|uniref:Uncharacterized protein n=1 Tax=Chlamydomonas eustigma TaxID=1157962 RepID=A0A250XG43_9CHLO|nr:hypothetical protein CEUSTIGMA_g9307.t1 [Chlamydomonas eustigma]|eukprot:GAX81879.1 hypothetical protein CEUSTIGMA_g9307.t1 [Chlamydomonas eustigma]